MINSSFKAHLLVLLSISLVAGSFIASANLAGIINPVSLTLLRFVGAVIILTPIVMYNKAWRNKIVSTMPRAMIIGFFYSAFFIGLFESLNTTTALNTATLYTLIPLGAAVLSAIVLKQQINHKIFLVYLFGMMGTLWVVFKGDIDQLLSLNINKGDFIFLLAALSMCCYTVAMKYLYRNDAMIVLVYCTLIGGCFWLAATLMILNQPLDWLQIKGDAIANISYLIIAATVATMYLSQKTVVILGPNRVNAYIFLNPALVALLLLIVDGQEAEIEIIPGVIVSIIATAILQRIYHTESVEKIG